MDSFVARANPKPAPTVDAEGRNTTWLSFLGFVVPFIGILHLIGALRIARPDSSWAQKRYGPEKLAIAEKRFA